MTNMFLILCACARVYMFIPDQANLYILFFFFLFFFFNAPYLFVSWFTGVHFNMHCMNVHELNCINVHVLNTP